MKSDRKARFLRRNAENRIRAGSAPSNSLPLDREALALLHTMAGDPARSSDALRILQELQVHQVELDLQRAQLESNEYELNQELSHYRTLFELMPTACLVVSREGWIVEVNPAAVHLLDSRQGELEGRELSDFLVPGSRAVWHGLLRALQVGGEVADGELLVRQGSDGSLTHRLAVHVSPGGEALLLTAVSREPVQHDRDTLQRA